MKFWMTPREKEITKDYWKFHQKFTAVDLVRRGEAESVADANECLKRMLKKSQVWPVGDSEEGILYAVTTESETEFRELRSRAWRARLPFSLGRDLVGSDMNRYETEEWADMATAMIQAKIKEIQDRRK